MWLESFSLKNLFELIYMKGLNFSGQLGKLVHLVSSGVII